MAGNGSNNNRWFQGKGHRLGAKSPSPVKHAENASHVFEVKSPSPVKKSVNASHSTNLGRTPFTPKPDLPVEIVIEDGVGDVMIPIQSMLQVISEASLVASQWDIPDDKYTRKLINDAEANMISLVTMGPKLEQVAERGACWNPRLASDYEEVMSDFSKINEMVKALANPTPKTSLKRSASGPDTPPDEPPHPPKVIKTKSADTLTEVDGNSELFGTLTEERPHL